MCTKGIPLLAPLVDGTKAALAALGTCGYAGPHGLGCTNVTAHPDTKMAILSSTTIARIHLTRSLFSSEKPPCALTDWSHALMEDNPNILVSQVRLHGDDIDEVVQECTTHASPTVNRTERRHVRIDGTTSLFAAHQPTSKKARKDKCPSKRPHLDTLRNVADSKPAMYLPVHSFTSHCPYCWKPELVGLTTPVLMESEH